MLETPASEFTNLEIINECDPRPVRNRKHQFLIFPRYRHSGESVSFTRPEKQKLATARRT
jgi:hypothetical protein